MFRCEQHPAAPESLLAIGGSTLKLDDKSIHVLVIGGSNTGKSFSKVAHRLGCPKQRTRTLRTWLGSNYR